MKLVATVLCGPDLSALDRAVASIVDHVDQVILIDTVIDRVEEESPPNAPSLVSIAKVDAGPKIALRSWPWRDDFAAARNEALALACELGADWALTTDADEWWENPEQIRKACLEAKPTDEALYFESGGWYWQPRVIRLPCAKRWDGRVHEGLAVTGTKIRGPKFHEDPKNPEQIRFKAVRDSEALLKMIAERPDEPRWLYYLGECYVALEEWQKAVDAFMACANKRGWYEERAIACLRAGEILTTALHDHEGAVEVLAHGMAAHAGISEIPYLAAVACLRAGKDGQALYWARLAEVHGVSRADDGAALAHRLLPVRPDIFEGPERVIQAVYKSLGRPAPLR